MEGVPPQFSFHGRAEWVSTLTLGLSSSPLDLLRTLPPHSQCFNTSCASTGLYTTVCSLPPQNEFYHVLTYLLPCVALLLLVSLSICFFNPPLLVLAVHTSALELPSHPTLSLSPSPVTSMSFPHTRVPSQITLSLLKIFWWKDHFLVQSPCQWWV